MILLLHESSFKNLKLTFLFPIFPFCNLKLAFELGCNSPSSATYCFRSRLYPCPIQITMLSYFNLSSLILKAFLASCHALFWIIANSFLIFCSWATDSAKQNAGTLPTRPTTLSCEFYLGTHLAHDLIIYVCLFP